MPDEKLDNLPAEYLPAEVAEMIGITTDNLRDWRRRELLNGIGQSVGRGWKYTIADAAALWIGVLQGRVSAFKDAKLIAMMIITSVIGKKLELPIIHYDYAPDEIDLGESCLFIAQSSYRRDDGAVHFLEDLSEAPREFLRAEVINIGAFYRRMPSDLREAIFVADLSGERSGKEVAASLAKYRPQDGRDITAADERGNDHA